MVYNSKWNHLWRVSTERWTTPGHLDTLTATKQTGQPGEAKYSSRTEFFDYFPTGLGGTDLPGQFASDRTTGGTPTLYQQSTVHGTLPSVRSPLGMDKTRDRILECLQPGSPAVHISATWSWYSYQRQSASSWPSGRGPTRWSTGWGTSGGLY